MLQTDVTYRLQDWLRECKKSKMLRKNLAYYERKSLEETKLRDGYILCILQIEHLQRRAF